MGDAGRRDGACHGKGRSGTGLQPGLARARAGVSGRLAGRTWQDALDRYLDLTRKLMELTARQRRLREETKNVTATTAFADSLEAELTRTLKQAGVCPTCGQGISHL